MDLSRNALLFDLPLMKRITSSRILLLGLGGVGGSAYISLVRHGVENITIVDFDTVHASNLNRQILFNSSDIGKLKVDIARKVAEQINSDAKITPLNIKFPSEQIVINLNDFDFVIDAIDDINAKVFLIENCIIHEVPFISCLGMGNRIDPSMVKCGYLSQTEGDPLAKKLRSMLRLKSIDLKRVNVVYSVENPLRKEMPVGSTYSVPNVAGIFLAQRAIDTIIKKECNHAKNQQD